MTLSERFDYLLTCKDRRVTGDEPASEIVDVRDHLPYFRSIARGGILEIGADVGNSTTAFLLGVEEHGGYVTSIDINPECAKNFVHPQWAFFLGDSQSPEMHELLKDRVFDILYIDGDHSYEAAVNDLGYMSLVRPGGLILVHDVVDSGFPGVRQAFDEIGGGTIRSGSWGLGVIVK